MSKIVYRTLDVFEVFAQQKRPLSLTELVRQLDIPVSSCHDVVRALEERGYLYEVRPRGGYYPTSRLFELSKIILDNDPVADRAEPILRHLSDALNASVSLAKAKEMQLTYLMVLNPVDPLRFSVNAGDRARNLYATSAGKALLGSISLEERRNYLKSIKLQPLTPHTLTDIPSLLADIEASEQRGWFSNCEESVEDALTLSVRFVWSDVIYVITAAGTLNRMQRQLEQASNLLMESAQQLQRST